MYNLQPASATPLPHGSDPACRHSRVACAACRPPPNACLRACLNWPAASSVGGAQVRHAARHALGHSARLGGTPASWAAAQCASAQPAAAQPAAAQLAAAQPVHKQGRRHGPARRRRQSCSCPHSDDVSHGDHEDLAVADLACVGRGADDAHHVVHLAPARGAGGRARSGRGLQPAGRLGRQLEQRLLLLPRPPRRRTSRTRSPACSCPPGWWCQTRCPRSARGCLGAQQAGKSVSSRQAGAGAALAAARRRSAGAQAGRAAALRAPGWWRRRGCAARCCRRARRCCQRLRWRCCQRCCRGSPPCMPTPLTS
jgi:hypothetical protein